MIVDGIPAWSIDGLQLGIGCFLLAGVLFVVARFLPDSDDVVDDPGLDQ